MPDQQRLLLVLAVAGESHTHKTKNRRGKQINLLFDAAVVFILFGRMSSAPKAGLVGGFGPVAVALDGGPLHLARQLDNHLDL